jgi:ACS family tartrate transporter-like MFS transporter
MSSSVARAQVRRKITRRLMPFLGLLYLVNYLDRTTLSIVGPNGMNADLMLGATAFGLASGIFFIGYILLEVPSNLALHRFGARRWLARIVVSWGVVACATAFVPNAETLYVMRLLLGIAEAGFAPGVILYLTYWFSREARATAIASFEIAIPLSTVVGAPLMSWLVVAGDDLLTDVAGWRFTLFATGLPSVLLGIACWFFLTDRPADARWLSAEEKQILSEDLARDEPDAPGAHRVRDALMDRRVWLAVVVMFGILYGMYAIGFFLPTIITGFEAQFGTDYSVLQVGLLTAIPYSLATIAMLVWARHSDRVQETSRHVAIPAVLGAAGLIGSIYAPNPFLAMLAISVGACGILSALVCFWNLPTRLFAGAASAACIALVNAMANTGSFFGPYVTGWLNDATGDRRAGLVLVSAFLLLTAVMMVTIFRDPAPVVPNRASNGARERLNR